MSTEKQMEFFGGGWREVDSSDKQERSKIIDAHFHIFRRFGTGSGPESAQLTLNCGNTTCETSPTSGEKAMACV